MTRPQWVWLPLRLATALVAAAALVMAITWYGSGEQAFATTQLPYVLVGGGIGCGLVIVAGGLYLAQLKRLQHARTADALARVLLAADRLVQARLAARPAGPPARTGRRGSRTPLR